jgi:hypothetical protein
MTCFSLVKITCFFVEDFANSSLLPSIFASKQAILPQRKINPGLIRGSLGLSRLYRKDLEQLDAGLLLYDAFYSWARDASHEAHQHLQKDTDNLLTKEV